jgi:protein-tyrosine phosphatase family protein
MPRRFRGVFIPPPNFGMVEDGLYRSGHPSELNFPFLESLALRQIIYLAPDDPSPALYVVLALPGMPHGACTGCPAPVCPRQCTSSLGYLPYCFHCPALSGRLLYLQCMWLQWFFVDKDW